MILRFPKIYDNLALRESNMLASALIASLKVKLFRRYLRFTQQSVLWTKTDLVVTLIFFVFFQTPPNHH